MEIKEDRLLVQLSCLLFLWCSHPVFYPSGAAIPSCFPLVQLSRLLFLWSFRVPAAPTATFEALRSLVITPTRIGSRPPYPSIGS
jgi:hypothetical protein